MGFDDEGRLLAWDVGLNANGGAAVDLSLAILERSMLHADNAYHIPAARIVGRACRTDLPPNTAFRGFGAPRRIFVIGAPSRRIAQALGLDPAGGAPPQHHYQEGQLTPYGQPVHDAHVAELLEHLGRNARYAALRTENEAFNAAHVYAKRGLGVVPVKFGISFTSAFLNQGSALIWIYADGTLSLSHWRRRDGPGGERQGGPGGGPDPGRRPSADPRGDGQHQARGQRLAHRRLHGRRHQRQRRPRRRRGAARPPGPRRRRDAGAAPGAHAGADALVFADDAVWDTAAPAEQLAFDELVHQAYMDRVDLSAHGYYRTPGVHFDRTAGQGTPFHYFAQGGGWSRSRWTSSAAAPGLLKVHIVHETGRSLNLAVDRGQIAGAFVQGFGWCTIEEERFDAAGRWLAVSPSAYKIPTIRDVPKNDFVIETVERDLPPACWGAGHRRAAARLRRSGLVRRQGRHRVAGRAPPRGGAGPPGHPRRGARRRRHAAVAFVTSTNRITTKARRAQRILFRSAVRSAVRCHGHIHIEVD